MTRSDLLTVGTARSIDMHAPGRTRWTCDDDSYWGVTDRAAGSTMTDLRERTTVRRSPAPRDSRRPDGGAVDYRRRSNGVSQVEHRTRRGHGFATSVAVALITAVSALGLVGLANMRSAAVPAQPSVSQQAEMGVVAGR
ncbi:hypothetical protein HQ325_20305 [Rhodococcus sp. BP-349]|uniref:hypothetical protein n=1 Tax=unclassified Rhodococcus (in: high G+C Gram-positive bacteria) TaxID=192944 RepID=UPI001C9B59A4|nr:MULTISPECIES: hypothetical protein [unclassified Rhodococcus (in: high G+C Gram-positive bacteria)]MBY6541016.1 hypothetical protein [Rhodococcus sp. BP-363]MBY6544958.1 hypothetical protein [Rhodococcus sp. BP-369]MBY6564188.1 hypothetical protein [Rhodococcus sp. BP-370]MBY6578875.1 hypothetical protein [Rhodococcus sp. BP-364]MBY6588176.1 hypothetical protein [Rhodococcus sp. BP-358]